MRRWGLILAVVVAAVGGWGAAWKLATFSRAVAAEFERAAGVAAFAPRAQASVVFDRHGRPAFTYFVEQRTDVPLERVSPHMIAAILAVEDRRFFSHRGIDPIRIAGAAWKNFKAGRIVEGGSTITQQLARAAQLSPVRTYERKILEVMVAAHLERRYAKRQILEEYLNTVYYGEGFYGIEAAARGYFGRSAADLTLPDAALLAALVRSPSHDAPCVSPERATRRRNLVLALMHKQERISAADLQAAIASPIPDASHETAAAELRPAAATAGLYFDEEIRRQLFQMFGGERVLRGGLRVHTTYDPALQAEAERAVASRLAEIAKSRRGAANLQASLVAMSPTTGDVYAMVGGRDFRESSFNRATQARRQAGSTFKPIVYAAALERGLAPGTLLRNLDTPIMAAEGEWLPGGGNERPEYTLRAALRVSSNRAAAQLLQQVGFATTVTFAERLGIRSPLPRVPSLALGTGEVTLLELTAAYSAFANHGLLATPRLITRVEDASGTTLYSVEERRTQVISRRTAYLMSSMLSDVISGGTAARARAAGFRLPAAGKTGTTNDYADAWFIGYTPHLLAGVWFGLDQPAPIMRGGFGGVVAVPAWASFMGAATKGDRAEWYRMPSDVERVAICRESGARAGALCHTGAFGPVEASYTADPAATAVASPSLSDDPPVYEDLFPVGAIPRAACPLHDTLPQHGPAALIGATRQTLPVIATVTAVRP